MLCAPYKRSLDILQQNWTFGTKGQKLQILCVWQKRTGEVKVHLLVSHVLIIAASEKMDYPRKLAIYYTGRERTLNVLCQPVKGNPDLKSSVTEQPGTQTASQSTWDTPCALPSIPILTVAKLQCYWEAHYRTWDSASFGKRGFADSFKQIARCYLTVCWYQKDTCYTVVFINKIIYCLKLK